MSVQDASPSVMKASQLFSLEDAGHQSPEGISASSNPEDGEEGPDAGAVSDDSDDEVADFRMLLPHLTVEEGKGKVDGCSLSPLAAGSIPKRGEKDFEPTGFRGQEKKLEESLRAMEIVIGQERRVTSKSLSTAIWHPDLKRAVVDLSRGTVMATLGITNRAPVTVQDSYKIATGSNDVIGPHRQVGVWKAGVFYPRYKSRTELLPEEALYLIERGSLDCRVLTRLKDSQREVKVPLTLQHAFSLMIDCDGCTHERYQIYAYLKRLGYHVQRAQIADSLRAAAVVARRKDRKADNATATPSYRAAATGIIGDPERPLKLVTLFDLLTYFPRRSAQLLCSLAATAAKLVQGLVAKTLSIVGLKHGSRHSASKGRGNGLLGIGGRRWDSYNAVFTKLQIIPSGYDRAAPQTALPSEQAMGDASFEPYYYAWRPATHFRKTDPPLPEFRIVVASARETNLPKLHQFASMFSAVPLEGTSHDDDSEDIKRAQEQRQRNDESYGRGFIQKRRREEAELTRTTKLAVSGSAGGGISGKFLSRLCPPSLSRFLRVAFNSYLQFASLFAHLPPGCVLEGKYGKANTVRQSRKLNPFPALKAGRRSVILAVVDHGTTSMLRFGEAEFEKWKLMS